MSATNSSPVMPLIMVSPGWQHPPLSADRCAATADLLLWVNHRTCIGHRLRTRQAGVAPPWRWNPRDASCCPKRATRSWLSLSLPSSQPCTPPHVLGTQLSDKRTGRNSPCSRWPLAAAVRPALRSRLHALLTDAEHDHLHGSLCTQPRLVQTPGCVSLVGGGRAAAADACCTGPLQTVAGVEAPGRELRR